MKHPVPEFGVNHPFAEFLSRQPALVLDGGLATALQNYGCDLSGALWSAGLLLTAPEVICRVHRDYLAAGADCITTASYQASYAGLHDSGLDEADAGQLLHLSVELAFSARREFWCDQSNRRRRLRPLIAASVGPYGAFLADGSEYTGEYGIGRDGLRLFHERRWRLLCGCGADIMGCETIPSRQEGQVLLELLEETPGVWAWLSYCCRDGTRLCDGSRLVDAARDCDRQRRVAAVGVNCTSPRHVPSLIDEIRKGTDKPIIVYPNSGERYDGDAKIWKGTDDVLDWAEASREWNARGAEGIGGCCRVGPDAIAAIRRGLLG